VTNSVGRIPFISAEVNIELKDLSETRKSLVVTLDKGEVDAEHKAVVAEIAKYARLPGFRPGHAPAALVVKRFAKDILDELKGKVTGKAYRGGIEKTKLDVVNVVKVEEGTIEPGLSAAITFTIDVQPPFELPEYVGLPVQVRPTEPADAEIDKLIESLRQERADFKVAERPAQKGDFVKMAYEGSIDGKPIAEIVPEKQIYGKVPQTWEEVDAEQDGLIPGLGRQIAGLKAGDKKDVAVTFPAGFETAPELGGKAAVYAVDVQEVRERVLPALDAEFFKTQQVENLEALRLRLGQDLKRNKELENRRAQRMQVREALASRIEFALPESLIAAETQEVLRRFMEENLRRGVPEAEFEKNKKELYENARRAAVARVKQQILVEKVAEAEKIEVDERDIDGAIMREALRSNQRPDKVAKELSKDRDRLRSLKAAIVFDKALDFLVSKATITTAAPKL
jgi:trigger factor